MTGAALAIPAGHGSSMRRHLPTLVAAVTGLLLLTACSGGDAGSASSASGSSVAASPGTSDDAITADSRPADSHESMDHSTMSTENSATSSASVADSSTPATSSIPPSTPAAAPAIDVLPGMPPVTDPHNIYSDAGANMLGAAAQQSKQYAYVPHSKSGDVWVIDTQTFQVINKFPVGIEVQHVVPSWDMTALYATDDLGNVVRRIDPITGQPGEAIAVFDPYNMYFTPDGKSAISVAEAIGRWSGTTR